MKFENFIAKRYVISKNKLNFISIISILSTLGIMIGVGALIVVISVFNGFSSLVTSYLVSFDPHLQIRMIENTSNNNILKLEDELKKIKDVNGFSPFVSGKVLAYRNELAQVINLKGIKKSDIYDIKSKLIFGEYNLERNNTYPKAILG